MSKPFITCFAFLHHKTKSIFKTPISIHKMTSCYRRKKPPIKFSSNFDPLVSSFIDMQVCDQFKQVFNLIDANGDGKISSTELSEMLSCLGHKKSIAAKEAEGMIREVDFNGDGFRDLGEFMAVLNGVEGKTGGLSEEDDNLMDAFLVFDIGKNGLISAEELQRLLVNLGCERCSLRQCRLMIKGVDKNGDGFVDFDEFRSMMKTGPVAD